MKLITIIATATVTVIELCTNKVPYLTTRQKAKGSISVLAAIYT